MSEITLGFPIEGRDDSIASVAQNARTTTEAQNVRGVVEGRLQGGRRPGMGRVCAVAVGDGMAGSRALASVVSDQQHVSYAALATPDTVWTADSVSGGDAYAVRLDSFGDSYTLDGGTHVIIRNSAGVEQKRLVLPVSDSGGVCRAMAIDSDARRVYVGVSTASLMSRSKLWCYHDHPYRGWEILWEIEPGAFVEKLTLIGTTLYAALNDTDTGRSYVATYDNLGVLAAQRSLMLSPAVPITTLDVASHDGDIAVGSGYNSDRAKDPRHPSMGQRLERQFASYWLNDLSSWTTRKYCVLDPETLIGDDGDEVLSLSDTYGSNREILANQAIIHLSGKHSALLGTQPANNDTISFALPDGTVTETYTFKSGLTPTAGEVLIGGSLSAALTNLETALEEGGDGTTVAAGTQPSTLVFLSIVNNAQATIKCNTQREVVEVTLSGSGNLTAGGAATDRVLSEKDVPTTGAFLKKNGMSGRQCLYFNGTTSRMVTLDNPNKLASSADEHHTLFPGYGNVVSTASSARFAAFFVLKPYPTNTKSCAVAQTVELSSGTWTRRIVSNRNASGVYAQGSIGVVENDGGTIRTHSASYLSGDTGNFTLVCIVSNPTGNYEVYVNGVLALNGAGSGTGTAVANDSKFKTHLGQSQYAPEDERFWEGELHKIAVVHSASTPITTGEREYYEGVLAWHYGAQAQLPALHPYCTVPPPPSGGATTDWYKARQAITTTPLVAKFDGKTERLAWIAASDMLVNTLGGLGYGIKWLSDGDLITVGPPVQDFGVGSDSMSIRRLVDQDDTFSIDTNDGAWSVAVGSDIAETFTYDKLELDVDEFDNVYIPFYCDFYESPPPLFLVYSAEGDLLLSPFSEEGQAGMSIAVDGGTDLLDVEYPEKLLVATRREATTTLTANATITDGVTVTFDGIVGGTPVSETYTFKTALTLAFGEVLIGASVSTALNNLKACINHDTADPTLYSESSTDRSQLVTATVHNGRTLTFSQRAYEADTTAASSSRGLIFVPDTLELSTGTLRQMRLVESNVTGESGRARVQVAIVGADIWKSDATSAEIPEGGEGVINTSTRYWHSVAHFDKVFFTDGQNQYVYRARTNTVEPFVASSGGTLPSRFQMLEEYRSRLLVFGIAGRPYSIVGSRVGDPFNFNRSALVNGTQSFDTSFSHAGDVADAINGVAPMGDDLALVICDHSLWQMTGDPAPGANGQFDRIPTHVGGAFGRAWCETPSGLVIWTSDGEPALVRGGGDPQPIVGARFRRTFQEINLSTHFVRMAWDRRMNWLNIVACPFGGVSDPSRAFVVEQATGAAWEDVRTDADLTFTDLIAVDGDAIGDRQTLFACADGVYRNFDEDANDDDGHAFTSRVVIGPVAYKEDRFETRLSRLKILLDSQRGDCFAELWISDEPSSRSVFRQRFTLRPGMSNTLGARVRGSYVWLVIEGNQPWAFQAASAFAEPGGIKRRRMAL